MRTAVATPALPADLHTVGLVFFRSRSGYWRISEFWVKRFLFHQVNYVKEIITDRMASFQLHLRLSIVQRVDQNFMFQSDFTMFFRSGSSHVVSNWLLTSLNISYFGTYWNMHFPFNASVWFLNVALMQWADCFLQKMLDKSKFLCFTIYFLCQCVCQCQCQVRGASHVLSQGPKRVWR